MIRRKAFIGLRLSDKEKEMFDRVKHYLPRHYTTTDVVIEALKRFHDAMPLSAQHPTVKVVPPVVLNVGPAPVPAALPEPPPIPKLGSATGEAFNTVDAVKQRLEKYAIDHGIKVPPAAARDTTNGKGKKAPTKKEGTGDGVKQRPARVHKAGMQKRVSKRSRKSDA